MRIDDENKTVWCSGELLDWYNSFYDPKIFKDRMIYYVSRVWWGHNFVDAYEKEVTSIDFTTDDKFSLIKAIIDDYEFKLEQPKKYYWRKKKEHLAWFEDKSYLILISGKLSLTDVLAYDVSEHTFTEAKARNLLKNDFDMFERVEVD